MFLYNIFNNCISCIVGMYTLWILRQEVNYTKNEIKCYVKYYKYMYSVLLLFSQCHFFLIAYLALEA